jgi:hypothetical protein
MSASGVFDFALYTDEKLAWHLIRSSGIVAYILLMGSTTWQYAVVVGAAAWARARASASVRQLL